MKITKRQLRRIVQEACSLDHSLGNSTQYAAGQEVPSPEDYSAARQFMNQNQDLVDLGISMVMDSAGTHCERSTAQAIIDHLQEMLGSVQHEELPYQEEVPMMMSPSVLDLGEIR